MSVTCPFTMADCLSCQDSRACVLRRPDATPEPTPSQTAGELDEAWSRRRQERLELAMRAPLTYMDVVYHYGSPAPTDDRGRAVFFAVWACLAFEWADAMLEAADDEPRHA